MKSLNSVLALIIGATLITAGVGCKKTPKPVTLIRSGSQATPSDGSGLINPVTLPPKTGTGPGAGSTLPPGDGANTRPITDTTGSNNLTTGNPIIDPTKSGEQGSRPPEGLAEHPEILKGETVYFDFDRATVRASERPKVDRVVTYLKSNPGIFLRVEGNCDERGTEDYNRSLGERRALAAREYIVNSGIAPERVTTVTYGEDKPADPGHDETAWTKNRRADFIVLGAPTTGIQ